MIEVVCSTFCLNQGANIAKHRKYVLPVLTLFYPVPRAINKKCYKSPFSAFSCLLHYSSPKEEEGEGRLKVKLFSASS